MNLDDPAEVSKPLDREGIAPVAPIRALDERQDLESRRAMATLSSIPSLNALRLQLASTKASVETQLEDLDQVIMRRGADLAKTTADKKRHGEALAEAGVACNDYQKLHHSLASWVGAIRDLQPKVGAVVEATRD